MNTATPREAIWFAARLRLPQSVSDDEIDTRTEDLLAQLGLLAVADALIGHERARGLSGGELRRVSLATELVARPSMIFLDEVTSGKYIVYLNSNFIVAYMYVCTLTLIEYAQVWTATVPPKL